MIGKILIVLFSAYIIGSIPFGLLVVRLLSGKDIRQIESGRTGGTNAMRAAGFLSGLVTMIFDALKGTFAIWLVQELVPLEAPAIYWLQITAGILAIIGHNYSLFLIERDSNGKAHFRGGAGGATTLGGAIGLWPLSLAIILPMSILVFVFIGYASVTTMGIAFLTTMVFLYRAIIGASPWAYVLFGVIAEILLIIALKPNIQRLKEGKERLVGLRAYILKKKQTPAN
ncbi:MAG: glycerol-3-phosphate acyltransferase [Anaerolineaceae bacterium]|nr:glycerol-3-phosphate acyltransferase [Anaerolineaceae bacterium]